MKITKSRLKQIIKEELNLVEASQAQVLEEGLLDDAIERLKAAMARESNIDPEVEEAVNNLLLKVDKGSLDAARGVEYVPQDPSHQPDHDWTDRLEEEINEDN